MRVERRGQPPRGKAGRQSGKASASQARSLISRDSKADQRLDSWKPGPRQPPRDGVY